MTKPKLQVEKECFGDSALENLLLQILLLENRQKSDTLPIMAMSQEEGRNYEI